MGELAGVAGRPGTEVPAFGRRAAPAVQNDIPSGFVQSSRCPGPAGGYASAAEALARLGPDPAGAYPGPAQELAGLGPDPAGLNRAGSGEAGDAELSWRAAALAGDPVAAYRLAEFYHERGDLDSAGWNRQPDS